MNSVQHHEIFKNAARIVVKVGTSSLAHNTGKLNLLQLEKLVRELADLRNQGKQVILVTSGAVGAGVGKLGLKCKPKTMPEKQAAAAVGQGVLLHMYEKIFAEYGQVVGQVLLTREDLADRKRYLNARHTLMALLQYGVLPIVNENDTVAVEEIRLGDNDTLSALVAGLVDADLLVLLSDIEGLYNGNPKTNPEACLIPVIEEITPEVEALAGGAGTSLGTGGMGTKLQAAKIAMNSGIPMVIAHGAKPGILQQIVTGEFTGTLFVPREARLHTKKRWIAFGSGIQGKITVDAGAQKAVVDDGKSLLPIGITAVEGNFEVGNVVSIHGPSGGEFARGIVNYASWEIEKIKGKNTSEILGILGHKDYDEVIHRDNLAIKL
ncbi:glutamate 5-kinase [Zhaonella formicivorans]|uniref:glutamate 5-kinase n=1 Tax=Zhaonella formicivorans TaxID=2528593 RepID=UPI001D10C4DF|nr:glutamate 5-kinase [Zhaonella formicivorans]